MGKNSINKTNFTSPPLGGLGGANPFRGFRGVLFVCFLLLISFSCRKPAPQLPSNKPVIKEETQTLDLVKVNKELVQKEDSLLTVYVQTHDSSFKKSGAGFWYKKELLTQNLLLKKDDVCSIDYQLYSLDGVLLEEVDNLRIVVGKKEFIPGLDEALELMRVGERASFIFPSNLAFGMKGYKNLVPAYTSVVLKVQVGE